MALRMSEYCEEVIEAIMELSQKSHQEAEEMTQTKKSDVEHGYKYRLSPSIIAGAILGINDCCRM